MFETDGFVNFHQWGVKLKPVFPTLALSRVTIGREKLWRQYFLPLRELIQESSSNLSRASSSNSAGSGLVGLLLKKMEMIIDYNELPACRTAKNWACSTRKNQWGSQRVWGRVSIAWSCKMRATVPSQHDFMFTTMSNRGSRISYKSSTVNLFNLR